MKTNCLLRSAVLLCAASSVAGLSAPVPTITDPNHPLTGMGIDTEAAFAQSTFPVKPDNLIKRAQEVVGVKTGLGTRDGGECLADDFVFCAAVVGPLSKKEYLGALGSFRLEDSFDISSNMFGFTVSPVQPNRVYFFSHQVAKMTAPFFGAKPETVKEDLVLPPQCLHLDFNEDLEVTEMGFYTVDRQYGNTGGLGGAFGFFYGAGKPLPFPEGNPYKRSFRFKVFNFVGQLAQKFQKKDDGSK